MTIEADDFAENLAVTRINRFVFIIFRLESNGVLFAEISLYRRFVIDEGDDDFAVFCRVLMANDELVAFEDAGIFHAVPLDDEHEAVVIADEISREGIDVFDAFFGKEWGPGADLADEGEGDDFLGTPGTFVEEFDGPVLGRVAADIAQIFQTMEVAVDRRRRAQSDFFTDFPYRTGDNPNWWTQVRMYSKICF